MRDRLKAFYKWRLRKLNERQFLLVLSAVIGFIAGLTTVLIKNSVYYLKYWIHEFNYSDQHLYSYFVLPAIGILSAVILQKYVLNKWVGHGIPSVLYAISKKKGKMKKGAWYESAITAPLTVAFGGSVGLEGPSVGTSAGFASMLGKYLRLNHKSAMLLLGCGATASLSGIFNAPVAAVVFALEVIMLDLTMASLIPLLIASVCAALTSGMIHGDGAIFQVRDNYVLEAAHIPWFIVMGIFTGLVSVYFNRSVWYIEDLFNKIDNRWKRFVLGAGMLGVLLFIFPPLYGEGFGSVNAILKNNVDQLVWNDVFDFDTNYIWVVVSYLMLLVIFKALAAGLTFSAGGVGGVFAPCLFTGAALGAGAFRMIERFVDTRVNSTQFALLGMAGMLSGVLHSPLTAIFLIAELTSGYELFIPLMITVTASFLVSKGLIPNSLYTMQLAKRGELITHHKDKAVLTMMELKSVIENDFGIVTPEMNLGEIAQVVARSKRNLFPVVDDDGMLMGVILLDDIREVMFKKELYEEMGVDDFVQVPGAFIEENDSMEQVMKKFQNTGAWNLPVIINDKYAGFVSKSKLFNAYRKVLVDFSEE